MEKKCQSINSIKSKYTSKNIRKMNIFNLISKFIFLLLYILIIIILIIIIKNNSNDNNNNNKSSQDIKSKRKMSSDYSNNKNMEEINNGYTIFGVIVILGTFISIIFIVILILIFYKDKSNSESYKIVLAYALCINITYIICASLLFGRVPSIQIGYLIIPYLTLIPIFIVLIIKKAFCFCCKISMKEYFNAFYFLPFIMISHIFKDSSCDCDCCSSFSCSCCCSDTYSSSRKSTNKVMVIIGYVRTEENIGSSRGVTHSSSSYSSGGGDCCFFFCEILKCHYIFFFLYMIFLGSAFIYNSDLYYIGLIALSIIICVCFLFYIIPLLIAFLFTKCFCCCDIIEEINNKDNDKLSYSYYCNNNKTPLVFAFILIILSILATAAIFILINITKIKEELMLFFGLN